MEPDKSTPELEPKAKLSLPALILIYLTTLILCYGWFINEALRMGGAEGSKIIAFAIISLIMGLIYFIVRSITAKAADRAILDSTTTVVTLVISIGLMVLFYTVKDFVPSQLFEKVVVNDQI